MSNMMKKILISLLILGVFSGCTKDPVEETPVTTTPEVEITPSPTITSDPTTTPTIAETPSNEMPEGTDDVSSSSEAAKEVYATINDMFEQAANKVKEEGKMPYALSVSYSDNFMSSARKGYQITCLVDIDGTVWRYNDFDAVRNNIEFEEKFDVSNYYKVEELYEFIPGKVTREEAINAALDYLGFTFEDLTLIQIDEGADSTRSYYYVVLANIGSEYVMKIDANTKEIFDYYDSDPNN